MGVFNKNQEELAMQLGSLKAQVEYLTRENEALREERDVLFKRVDSLQDALIAVKSPESYQMLQNDRAVHSFPSQDMTGATETQKFIQDLTAAQEGPLFKDRDDFMRMVGQLETKQLEGASDSSSVHGNSES
jgi:hypothetical protein